MGPIGGGGGSGGGSSNDSMLKAYIIRIFSPLRLPGLPRRPKPKCIKARCRKFITAHYKSKHIRKIYRFSYSVIQSLVGKWQLGLADTSGFSFMTVSVRSSVTES